MIYEYGRYNANKNINFNAACLKESKESCNKEK